VIGTLVLGIAEAQSVAVDARGGRGHRALAPRER
jgi:hypothetical protein